MRAVESETTPLPGAGTGPSRAPVHRVRAVLNAGGGTMMRLGTDRVREQLTGGFAGHGITAELVFATGEELRQQAEAARTDVEAGRLDAVIAGGGDGSISTVAGVLAGSGVPMGVLPLGTRNHFARDLGMPLDLEEAVAAIAGGTIRSVDVGEVNGRVFVNNSLIGAYPFMVIDRDQRREVHGLGKWTAMTLAFFRMLRQFPRRRLKIGVEGRTRPYRTPFLFIGVNEYSFQHFTVRRQDLTAGKLWLLVSRQQSRLGLVGLALRAAFSDLRAAKDVVILHVETAEVRTKASRVPVARDGEVDMMPSPFRYRVRPGALRVIVPTPATGRAARA